MVDAPRRILIYGVCGSGKSTFARRLSERTGIPWHSVDDLAFLPGWVSQTDEYLIEKISEICAGDEWILDTAYGKWLDVVLPRAELIVGLDYPRWLSFARLVRRTVTRIVDQEPVCNGNRETVRNALSRRSILLWHYKSFRRKQERMRAWSVSPDAPETLLFKRPGVAEAWLTSLSK